MNNIRVLITGPSLQDPGGVANYYNAVLPWLADNAVDAHYVEIGSTHGGGRLMHLLHDQLRVWRAIGSVAPDIVHLNPSLDLRSFLRDGLFLLLARLRRRPVLVFFRGWQVPFESRVEGGLRWFFAATYLRADGFIVLARRFADKLRQWGVRCPVFTATTAVADESLKDLDLERKLADIGRPGVVRLLYLARLERDKGVMELLEAVLLLLARGLDVSLTIAGDGAMLDAVRARLSEAGAHGRRIRLAGYLRGAAKSTAFQQHHIYCFPTLYGEGMPNSVLEAMGFGLPVVTCAVGGLGDLFQSGKMGILLQGNSPAEIAGAIEELVSDRERLVEMASFNHEFATANFLASKVARGLRECYLEILETVVPAARDPA